MLSSPKYFSNTSISSKSSSALYISNRVPTIFKNSSLYFFNFSTALFIICLALSRVKPNWLPISSNVWSIPFIEYRLSITNISFCFQISSLILLWYCSISLSIYKYVSAMQEIFSISSKKIKYNNSMSKFLISEKVSIFFTSKILAVNLLFIIFFISRLDNSEGISINNFSIL